MRKSDFAPYCVVLTVGNCCLPSLLSFAAKSMRIVYYHSLGNVELCKSTQIALALPLWFYLFNGLSILACAGLFIRKVSVPLLVHWLLVICLLECACLLCFALGLGSSFFGVFWTIGKE